MDPKLETELRDLQNRFSKKTGKAHEAEEVDITTFAENKQLANQQRNNNIIKYAEQKFESETRAEKSAEKELGKQKERAAKAREEEK